MGPYCDLGTLSRALDGEVGYCGWDTLFVVAFRYWVGGVLIACDCDRGVAFVVRYWDGGVLVLLAACDCEGGLDL